MTKCKVIALANQKGGTAKTTTTLNLGIGLAHQGRKVLLVDADPQGDLTTALGWTNADNLPITLDTQMKKILQDEPFVYNEGILHHKEGVDIIPTNIELSGMEISLVNAMSREQTLKLYLADLKKDYDYILIDCMPSLGMLTINALAAADSVIVPVQAHYLPLKGMTQLMKTIGKVQRQLNTNLKIDGVLLTLADMRTKLAKTTEDSLRENYGKHIRIFKTVIPVAITAAESSAAGQSIYEYDKNGTVAKAYLDLFFLCLYFSKFFFCIGNIDPPDIVEVNINLLCPCFSHTLCFIYHNLVNEFSKHQIGNFCRLFALAN